MLSLAVRNTAKLVREKSKSENIRLGRLFTKKETARRMASMFTLDTTRSVYTILDPGAGTGILSSAIVERICKEAPMVKQIYLTAYENNAEFCAMLEDNLERIRKKARHDYGVKLFYTVYEENYILDAQNHYTVTFFDATPDTFDLIICNPPQGFIEKASDEARVAGGVTQIKINEAFLFAKMARAHLEEDGQLVCMLPTTVATATELKNFRLEMSEHLSISRIHLFVGVQKNKSRATPLKKNIIIAYRKGEAPENISITTSTDHGTPEKTVTLPPLPYRFVVKEGGVALTLPKSAEDTQIVRYLSSFPETLSSLGLKMYTGLVIDSRVSEMLFSEPTRGAVPLFRPNCISGGVIRFPLPIKNQYIAPLSENLVQRNKNMIFIKRVPAKGDERFLNCAIYIAAGLPSYRYISTHNKINFIDTRERNAEMNTRFVWGLFALLNSTIYDRYLSIVSKSTQINSKEMQNLPLPERHIIENIGVHLMTLRATDVASCDSVVNPVLRIRKL